MGLSKIQQEIHTHTHTHTHTAGCSQHTQSKLLTLPHETHPIGQLRKNPQKKPLSTVGSRRKLPLEVAGNHSSTVGRRPQDMQENRCLCSPKKIGSSHRSTHLSQISFSPILLLPSSSNPKWGSGGDAGLKERDRRRCGIEREGWR
jgi:hypothetical protein